jgi:hypothetical protein
MTTMLYLGAGDDLYPLQLGLYNCISNEYLVKKSCEAGTPENTIKCLENIKTFILVDVVPAVNYYTYYPKDVNSFISYYTVIVAKRLNGDLIENNHKEKRLVFSLPDNKKLYYYYSTNLFFDQDCIAQYNHSHNKNKFTPSQLLLEQLKEVDVNLIWGFYYDEINDHGGFTDAWKKAIPNATILITREHFDNDPDITEEVIKQYNLKYNGDELKRFIDNTKITQHLTLNSIDFLNKVLF